MNNRMTGDDPVSRPCLRHLAAVGVFATLLVAIARPAEEQEKKTKGERKPDVIFVPTPHDVVDMMLLLARVNNDDVVYDLGCGDGRIVVAAAKKYGCKAVGYDIASQRVKASLENVKKNKVETLVRIEQKDIFTLDLRPATVVTLYLLSELNVRLIPQLEKLKPGCRIVSHDFDMRGVKPDMVLTMQSKEDDAQHTVYLWTTPLKKQKEGPKEEFPELFFEEEPKP